MTDTKVEELIRTFMKSREAKHRYASFDYCFNYFHSFKNKGDLANPEHLQTACLHLGMFLASWGMYRGKGALLKKASIKHFESVVGVIAQLNCSEVWSMDANTYDQPATRDRLIECYERIRDVVTFGKEQSHWILVTKVMLGVFGCTPAFDTRFTKTFRALALYPYDSNKPDAPRFRRFNDGALSQIGDFYKKHSGVIDKWAKQIKTLGFETGMDTKVPYTKAKIIDMVGFQANGNIE